MYFVYILKSLRDNKLYVGYSNNPKKRLALHNQGRITITKHRKPFELIYLEGFRNQQDATTREKFYKTGWGRTHLKKILKNYLNQPDD
ncbi:MAG: GIY-YIG nuclease family protein [Candidatus Chisholmbacteria bacterium]|nr:GIY-YIG nuclease family protein [Candidatus Chisholmbacteria bacterium]